MITVAWLGLGRMGRLMARRVLDAGHDVWLWNRTAGRAAVLSGAGGRLAATPAEAVHHADVVILMLADAAAVGAVTEGPDGIEAAVRPHATVVDMSTAGPDAVARLRTALPDGVILLDAPVLGSVAEAGAGTLTILVGGPPDAVAEARPLLSLLGSPLHMGPVGAGAAAKLVANAALIGTLGVLGETVALADGLGLPREVAWRVLALTPLAGQAERRRPMVESGSYPARFGLALARKDAGLIVTTTVADLRLARAALTWLADAEAAGLGGADYTAVLSHILAAHGDRA